MNNLETLRPLAETALRGPAEKWAKLSRHLVEIKKRADAEAVELVKAEEDLARVKALAGDYLADGSNAFDRYKTRLKKALARLETAVESTRIFERELVPGAKRDLEAARLALSAAAATFYAASKATCEAEMAEALGLAVAAHDDFLAAFQELARTFDCSFPSGRAAPAAYSVRLDEVKHTLTGRRWLTFTRAPAVAVPAAPAAPATRPAAAIPVAPARVESTRVGEIGPEATEARPLPPEAPAEALGVAAERPGAAASRARVLRCSIGDAGDVPPTPVEPMPDAAPADLDPYPLPPDADGLDAQGEAPPEAGQKENPKIVPDCS